MSNKALLGAVSLTFVLQMAVIYVPALQKLFKTVSLPLDDLMVTLAVSTAVLAGVELQKWGLRRSGSS
jgi:Ca2+-transporting ATPase